MQHLTSRLAVCVSLGLVLTALITEGFTAENGPSKPNIVLLLADDLGYSDLSCYGADDVSSPTIDRLADQGVLFTNFYANGTECTPTRVALMTGRYPQRAGGMECAIGTGNVGRYDEAIRLAEKEELGLPPSQSVLASAMKQAGYATGVFGKWHLGYELKFNPLNHGFDEFFGFLGGNVDYFTHTELSDLHVLYRDRKPIDREGYMTHLITRDSVRFIRAHQDEPFFLYVPYSAPHFPFQGPDDATGQPVPEDEWTAGSRETYAEMIEVMDQGIGRILKTLDETQLAENTLVIFASDHGAMKPGRNTPFSGYKGGTFEGGIRAPCIIRWPGHIDAGITCDQAGVTMDLTASLLRIAGEEPPEDRPLDGIDIIHHVEENRPNFARTLFWRARRGDRTWWAVRKGQMKYVRKTDGGQTQQWLFHLGSDPAEENNLLDERPRYAKFLKDRLRQWEQDVQPVR